jgi:hypothetical protein
MADSKGTARARRSRPAQIIGSQRTQNMGWQANRVNVALPLSMIRAEKPATMRAGDWISLAGLVVSAIGFSVVIRELIRIAHASEAGQVSHRVSLEKADSRAGGSSSADAGARISRQ